MSLFKVTGFLAGLLFIVSCSVSKQVYSDSINKTSNFVALAIIPEAECEPISKPEILNMGEAMSYYRYPAELRREGIEGQVILELAVNEEGKILAFREKNNADYRLVKQTSDLLPYLKLEPGTCSGKKVTMVKEFKMSYRLNL